MFALASFVATGCGAVAMIAAGLPMLALTNLAAWAAGAVLAAIVARRAPGEGAMLWSGAITVAALGLTLAAPGQSDVHRWVPLGPAQVNVAGLLLPFFIVVSTAYRPKPLATDAIWLAVAALLMLQPDASQNTAFAAAVIAALLTQWRRREVPVILALMAIVAGTWLRPDPLEPVAHVEGVLSMCFAISPLLAVLAGLSLAALAASPFAATNTAPKAPTLAVSTYIAVICIAPLFGAFPVPLIGYGLSFPIGLWLGYAALQALPARRNTL